MSPLDSADFGFWRSFGSLRLGQVVGSWDFLASLLLAVSGAVLIAHHSPAVATHYALVGDILTIDAGVFAVVLAGFAIVAALLGDKYARMLEASGASSLQMLRHFLIVAGLLVTSVVLSLAFRVLGPSLLRWEPAGEQVALGIVLFSFLWSLFSTLELMKLILGVAVTNTALRGIEGGTAVSHPTDPRAGSGGEP